MKVLVFISLMISGVVAFAQEASTVQKRSEATSAELQCTMSSPDGDYALTMIFDYDLDARTYTLSSVGAAGRGTTETSSDYLWEIKSDIDLSRLAADVMLTQPDGSYIQFTMLARQTGIVMRRGDNGFLPEQNLSYKGIVKGKLISGSFKCWDALIPLNQRN